MPRPIPNPRGRPARQPGRFVKRGGATEDDAERLAAEDKRQQAEDRLRREIEHIFEALAALYGASLVARLRLSLVALVPETEGEALEAQADAVAQQIAADLDMAPFEALIPQVERALAEQAQEAARTVAVSMETEPAALAELSQDLAAFARDRAAELVGRRWQDGALVDDPNAEMVIDEATRDHIRVAISDGIRARETAEQIAERLGAKDFPAFSPARAKMIARTELSRAENAGRFGIMRVSNVASKIWVVDGDPCLICIENMIVGPIGLYETFPSGDLAPPQHPNCLCVIAPA